MRIIIILSIFFVSSFIYSQATQCSNIEHLDYENYILQAQTRLKEHSKSMGVPQYVDDNNQILPWYTKPFLNELLLWDIKDWDIFEWGSGYSTIWYASHCKSVTSIECDKSWKYFLEQVISEKNITNTIIKLRAVDTQYSTSLSEGGKRSAYVQAIEEDNKKYDCIIIDGLHRNECAKHVLSHLKPGGILILDNAHQKSIGINSTSTFVLFRGYEHHSFLQTNNCCYPDWRTDYWKITN